jgi:hypothetical protein
MSVRHRTVEAKPAPAERRIEHHRERQATRHALMAPDPEEIVDPRSHHSLHHPADRQALVQDESHITTRRVRHWKQPFWKRRTAARHQRNAAIAALRAEQG